MNQAKRIAFLGLGVMGAPMAGHLARAGHRVTVYNRTAERAGGWVAHHGAEGLDVVQAPSPAEAAAGQDVVLTCVGNDADLAEVVLGERGALGAMAAGSLLVDHTTVSPGIARRIATAAQGAGIHALDAPVSGGQAGAECGTLSIMCGGTDEAMAAGENVIEIYASRVVHIGPAGAGQATKSVNQVCIAGILGGLSEGLRLAQANGLDLDRVLEAISGGAARSWQMEHRWHTMARDEFDFGFAIDWMRKDLQIALDEAAAHELQLPVTALVDSLYAQVQAAGGGRLDTSALVRHIPGGSRA